MTSAEKHENGTKIISRNELFEDGKRSEEIDGIGEETVELSFEFEEKKMQPDEQWNGGSEGNEDDEAYEFPLFSMAVGRAQLNGENGSLDSSSTEARPLQKVYIRDISPEESVETVKRPESYYFAKYSDEDHERMKSVALTGDEILQQSKVPLPALAMPWKVIDFSSLNSEYEKEKRKSRRRPSQKLRKAVKEGRKTLRKSNISGNRVYGPTRVYGSEGVLRDASEDWSSKGWRGGSRGSRGLRGSRGARGARGGARGPR